MTTTNGGFAQKALIVLLGVLATGLMAFFIWLATTVIDIRERTARIEVSITSLLETRTTQATETTARTTRRVEQLEKAAEEQGQ